MIVSPGFVYLSIKGLMPDAGFFPQYLCINIEVRYFRYSLLFLYLHEYETNSFSKPNPVSGHAISENEPSPEKQVPRPFWRKVSSQRLTHIHQPPNWHQQVGWNGGDHSSRHSNRRGMAQRICACTSGIFSQSTSSSEKSAMRCPDIAKICCMWSCISAYE